MYKKLKERIAFWMQRYEEERKRCNDYRRRFDRLSTTYESFCNVMFDSRLHKLINIYTMDGFDYVVYISDFEHIEDYKFELNFISKPLYCERLDRVAVANIVIDENKLEIVSIDAYHNRKGHGSILLQCIEEYSAANEMIKIWGKIDGHTPIGSENLIRFYRKNGYDVYGTETGKYFRKKLRKEAI